MHTVEYNYDSSDDESSNVYNVEFLWPYRHNDLSTIIYHELMMDNVKKVTNKRMKDLKEIEKDMAHVTKAYNKKARRKAFQVGDMVWKTALSLGIEKHIWQVVSKLGRTIH
jgi:hypothetical protein